MEELNAAYSDGRLDSDEHGTRHAQAQKAATDDELKTLVRDLSGRDRRLTDAEREKAEVKLKRALGEGRLRLVEYESRVRSIYHSGATVANVRPLLADLNDPPTPPWRSPLDAAFDGFVFNSALLPAPIRWWQHVYPKLTWKILTTGTLLAWAYLLAGSPLWMGLTQLGAGWIPVAGLLALYCLLVRKTRRADVEAIAERQKTVVDGLQLTLRESLPGVREVKIEYDHRFFPQDATVTIEIRFANAAETIPSPVIDEIVRHVWLSRLYPLRHVRIIVAPSLIEVQFNRAERRRLQHLHGRRPYGPLPKDPDSHLFE